MRKRLSILLMLAIAILSPHVLWGQAMKSLSIEINGQSVSLNAIEKDTGVLVPLDAFCNLIDAEAKEIDGGPFSVCRDDLCIPLNVTGNQDTVTVDGTLFGRLDAFGEPLGLTWQRSNGTLSVNSGSDSGVGLGIGHQPPPFILPDLYTGKPVSLGDFKGKKTAFYMWASW